MMQMNLENFKEIKKYILNNKWLYKVSGYKVNIKRSINLLLAMKSRNLKLK